MYFRYVRVYSRIRHIRSDVLHQANRISHHQTGHAKPVNFHVKGNHFKLEIEIGEKKPGLDDQGISFMISPALTDQGISFLLVVIRPTLVIPYMTAIISVNKM